MIRIFCKRCRLELPHAVTGKIDDAGSAEVECLQCRLRSKSKKFRAVWESQFGPMPATPLTGLEPFRTKPNVIFDN